LLATSNTAFGVVFGLFLAGFAVLCFLTLRWAVRRDRRGRAAWLARQAEASPDGEAPPTNRPGRRR